MTKMLLNDFNETLAVGKCLNAYFPELFSFRKPTNLYLLHSAIREVKLSGFELSLFVESYEKIALILSHPGTKLKSWSHQNRPSDGAHEKLNQKSKWFLKLISFASQSRPIIQPNKHVVTLAKRLLKTLDQETFNSFLASERFNQILDDEKVTDCRLRCLAKALSLNPTSEIIDEVREVLLSITRFANPNGMQKTKSKTLSPFVNEMRYLIDDLEIAKKQKFEPSDNFFSKERDDFDGKIYFDRRSLRSLALIPFFGSLASEENLGRRLRRDGATRRAEVKGLIEKADK